jgi:methyl-accepting chemotaxis protein
MTQQKAATEEIATNIDQIAQSGGAVTGAMERVNGRVGGLEDNIGQLARAAAALGEDSQKLTQSTGSYASKLRAA